MTEGHDSKIGITVLGPFQVRDGDGVLLLVKGAKNQALLAMLALSPDMTRPRRWIEDKLWSTFGPEQASANLRQALSKLRSALGDAADVLIADRTGVSLDRRRVTVDLLEEVVPEDDRTELLQGMDVRDPEFEDWLRQERAALMAKLAKASPTDSRGILINCRVTAEKPGRDQMLGEVLANQIGENIAEQVRAWRQSETDMCLPASAPPSDILISTQLVDNKDGGHALFIKATHQPSARILYSKLQQLTRIEDILTAEIGISRTVFEAADQIIGKLPHVLEKDRPETRSTALSRLGLYRMFSFEKDALREAYGLMDQAFRRDENGVYLAWASMIRLTQMIEMAEEDQAPLLEEAVDLHYRAMELAPDNVLVHAIISKVRSTAFGDTAGVLDLAQNAVERNPANAFAWKSLSDALILSGDLNGAFKASERACRIARTSPFKHYWDTGHCIIAIACNRPQEAIEAGEAAARNAPLSRPAHRHLLALYALEGQLDKAQAVAEKLAKIEPGFSLDRLVNDDSYPVRTLRSNGLLEPIRALL
ncbi:transcriptional regulator [Antarctobacter jejuensis]|uniref:transcriptional regulator n=1 Tax=Antarctobacter jejuensis TaxID=1439938 RepID=UPI003FD0234F